MSPHAARIDHLPRRFAARVARAPTRCGGSARSRSQENPESKSEIPEIPENHRASLRSRSGRRLSRRSPQGEGGLLARELRLGRPSETAKCARRADGTLSRSHPAVAFSGGNSIFRVSPSERQETEPTGGQKHHQVRQLTVEKGDSNRHRSEVRKVSRIASSATLARTGD